MKPQNITAGILLGLLTLLMFWFVVFEITMFKGLEVRIKLEELEQSHKLELLQKVKDTCSNDDIKSFTIFADGQIGVQC